MVDKPLGIVELINEMGKKVKIDNDDDAENFIKNFGYFHGYKGYRFFKGCKSVPSNQTMGLKDIESLIELDSKLKELLYPQISFLEPSIRNRILISILKETNECDGYLSLRKAFGPSSGDNKKVGSKIRFWQQIYGEVNKAYLAHNRIAEYYLNCDRSIPIWSLMELITFGNLGHLYENLSVAIRQSVSEGMGIKEKSDKEYMLLSDILFLLKDLRNAISHNNAVYDCRFITRNPKKRIKRFTENSCSINNVHFTQIFDFVILVALILKLLGRSKEYITHYLYSFRDAVDEFKKSSAIMSNGIFDSRINGTIKKFVAAI